MREETVDVRVAKAQLAEVESLANQVQSVLERVKGNPSLVRRLQEVLDLLRRGAAASAA